MNKEDLYPLIGKYLNGYKIVKIENDPFIKGQINLFTDEWEYEVFNDRCLVKFFIREESNTSKIYKELVDEEKFQLKKGFDEIKEIIITHKRKDDNLYLNEWQTREILQIIDKVLGCSDENKFQ